jgi:hypothetical protein
MSGLTECRARHTELRKSSQGKVYKGFFHREVSALLGLSKTGAVPKTCSVR